MRGIISLRCNSPVRFAILSACPGAIYHHRDVIALIGGAEVRCGALER